LFFAKKTKLQLFVSFGFQESISLPFWGSFHLSLTVLVHYRSEQQYLGLEGGPPNFKQEKFSFYSFFKLFLFFLHGFFLTGLSPSLATFSKIVLCLKTALVFLPAFFLKKKEDQDCYDRVKYSKLAFSAFIHHYLRNLG